MFIVKCLELGEHVVREEVLVHWNLFIKEIHMCEHDEVRMAPLGKLHFPNDLVIIVVVPFKAKITLLISLSLSLQLSL